MEGNPREEKVAAFLSTGLSEWPQSTIATLTLPTRGRAQPGHRVLLAAAVVLVFALLLTSFYIPQVTRAIANIPVVGPVYEQLLERSGSRIAYSAGLLSNLNLAAKDRDMTVTVLGAYTDPLVTVITLKVQLDNEATGALMGQSSRFPRVDLRGRWQWHSGDAHGFFDYDESEDALYYSFQTTSVPWWVGNSVDLEVVSEGAQVELVVPLQRLPAKDVETVNINKSYLGGMIVVDKVVFSPGRTIIYWTTHDGYLAGPQLTPTDGTNLRELRSGIVRNSSKWQYEVGATHQFYREYLPSQSREFAIDLDGFAQETELLLPLKDGAKAVGNYVEGRLDEIRVGDEATDFVVTWANGEYEWEPNRPSMNIEGSSNVSPPPVTQETAPGKLLVTWPIKLRDDQRLSYRIGLLFSRQIAGSDHFIIVRP